MMIMNSQHAYRGGPVRRQSRSGRRRDFRSDVQQEWGWFPEEALWASGGYGYEDEERDWEEPLPRRGARFARGGRHRSADSQRDSSFTPYTAFDRGEPRGRYAPRHDDIVDYDFEDDEFCDDEGFPGGCNETDDFGGYDCCGFDDRGYDDYTYDERGYDDEGFEDSGDYGVSDRGYGDQIDSHQRSGRHGRTRASRRQQYGRMGQRLRIYDELLSEREQEAVAVPLVKSPRRRVKSTGAKETTTEPRSSASDAASQPEQSVVRKPRPRARPKAHVQKKTKGRASRKRKS
jgi:hypothetical protein